MEELEPSDIWSLCKHGIGLTILMFLLIIGWVFVLAFLLLIGSILGLLIGFAVLALALGYINSYLAETIWSMSVDGALIPRFFHGLLLLVILLIADIPIVVLNLIVQHWLVSVIIFIIYVPIHGFVAVKVAEVFETPEYETEDGEYWED